MRLAANLIGIDITAFTGDLRPLVSLLHKPEKIEHVPGFTLGTSKRKAEFRPSSWQLFVPVHLLKDIKRTEQKIAGLGARVAYTMAALMAHEGADAEEAAVMQSTRFIHLLSAVNGLVRATKEASDLSVAANPRGATAAVRHLARSTPQQVNDTLWHQGLRPDIKRLVRKAEDGDAPLAVLNANRQRRHMRPAVAWMRAVRSA